MNSDDLKELLEEEEVRWQRIRQMAGACAEDLARFWHMGDGLGGGILDAIGLELQKAGYPCQSPHQFYATRQFVPTDRKNHKVSATLKRQVFERDAYRCRRCSGYKDLSIDHIQPISKGGATEIDNLQALCRSCNSIKGATLQEVGP